MKYTINKCLCGHPTCKDHGITQWGMSQGSMFKSPEEAQEIADILNIHNPLIEALKAVSKQLNYRGSNKDINDALDNARMILKATKVTI